MSSDMPKGPFNITLWMKSGNRIVIDKILDKEDVGPDGITFRVGNVGNRITTIGWTQAPDAKVRLFFSSIDLSQIEAITLEQCHD